MSEPTANQPEPPPAAPPSPETAAPAPPPAATIVVTATRTEREIELEAELQRERSNRATEFEARKKAETEAAWLADENHRLKSIPAAPPPPKPRRLGPFGIPYPEN